VSTRKPGDEEDINQEPTTAIADAFAGKKPIKTKWAFLLARG
jgi:hypothetical protein